MKFYTILYLAVTLLSVHGNLQSEEEEQPPLNLEWWQRDFEKLEMVKGQDSNSMKGLFGGEFDTSQCSLSPELKAEIQSYQDVVNKIIRESTQGAFRGKTYSDLAYFVDTFGSRVSGSDSLENAITYLTSSMRQIGLSNVHEENATIPKWLRGTETAEMLTPRPLKLSIKGLGFSVPTPEEGITGEVVVIKSLREMSARKKEIMGKIVVYNSESNEGPLHCLIGAAMGSRMGAIAALARSATTFSLYSVHTGIQIYDERFPKIPVAALTLEDADLITRIVERGEKVTIHLKMTVLENTERVSRNIIGDYIGYELPEEYVAIAGHTDSWDVGQGALDDGVGPILALEVVKLFQHLNLKTRRTLRNMYFTSEEAGLVGVRQYLEEHSKELSQYSAAMEADFGCLRATGLLFSGSMKVGCIFQEILDLTRETNATSLVQTSGLYTDIYGMVQNGVPGVVLNGDDDNPSYMWYHHTEADSMTALKTKELDKCLAVWASTAYVIADLKEKLPRD